MIGGATGPVSLQRGSFRSLGRGTTCQNGEPAKGRRRKLVVRCHPLARGSHDWRFLERPKNKRATSVRDNTGDLSFPMYQ